MTQIINSESFTSIDLNLLKYNNEKTIIDINSWIDFQLFKKHQYT
ncbi:hypothetical protein BXY58_2064 [Epilithonimonas arachidiradicis]|uniref:Uncharacterized protein n=1 Tax=Epilithonimonas arachidiradicis TaxID=1617282 RepID=A0A420D978_9FLAO|nr:hypothetical protein BXY58_2064 [Epilithonimonas arachidiradicis]